jgi:hypothetical protein
VEGFETWYWRRMKKIIWVYRVRNEEVLHTAKEERIIILVHATGRGLTGLIIYGVGTAF